MSAPRTPPKTPEKGRPAGTPTRPRPGTEREALIAEALRVRRAKKGLLEALPPEEQFLLKVMANEMTGAGADARSRPSSGAGDAPRRRTNEPAHRAPRADGS